MELGSPRPSDLDCRPSASEKSKRKSRLLVSVRNLHEAQLAVDGGVDIVDFKEPLRGALAACDPHVWSEAVAAFAGAGVMLSAALGESESAMQVASQVPAEFTFAKAGPSGCRSGEWLQRLWDQLPVPESVALVPVAYADHETATTITPEEVLDAVIESGRSRLLIDTFVKDGRRLPDHLDRQRLTDILQKAQAHDVWVALAGSVRLREKHRLEREGCFPDCWGVRGDVCDNSDRCGLIDPGKISLWRRSCRTASVVPCEDETCVSVLG
ncbi:(5-formylfuran-3-yl)methyl phosphate synthase [Rhodopirellula halodulae]|uniref:(5-formylfuran-3-yl)methyl phosphate synthase n=1 Tax=Rhodopirellula halodulae TaxID=2894198 RepID=UPI001E658E34|nr:(5-formylfuran-3-yl)methyl phosphate synthase [Rhodopirellula sp. JC737]MCC9658157.1 (5-formylfuran-3-yl)methyl phosphate synthase [Rhodopirellula sp. JC737]